MLFERFITLIHFLEQFYVQAEFSYEIFFMIKRKIGNIIREKSTFNTNFGSLSSMRFKGFYVCVKWKNQGRKRGSGYVLNFSI